MSSDPETDAWADALLVARLVSANPRLPGVIVRSRAGAVRDRLLGALPSCDARIHPSVGDDTLFGGIDVTATLASGTVVRSNPVIAPDRCLLVTMAERVPQALAGRLAHALDDVSGLRVILLDEGIDPDERIPDTLRDRVPFEVCLDAVRYVASATDYDKEPVSNTAEYGQNDVEVISQVALKLGIQSVRPLLFALETARTLAALDGRKSVIADDLQTACRLTLAHRATVLPDTDAHDATPPTEPTDQPESEADRSKEGDTIPQDLLLEAILTSLPPDLLAQNAKAKSRSGSGSGAGAKQKGNRRGRPLPARPAKRPGNARLDLYATLRAAAPWQTLRRKQTGLDKLHLRAEDLRIKHYEYTSERLVIFAVDASGSAAISRLAEAKGAIELLLSDAYARRDHVALVSFRGKEAEILLPPSRSLVQTKRRLADLPGGGGTPLASGMETALQLAIGAKRKGMMPKICILTDGRANIDKQGNVDRKQAMLDAETMAKAYLAQGLDTLVIDTGNRPERKLRDLAGHLQAQYLPMPRANAERLSQVINTAAT